MFLDTDLDSEFYIILKTVLNTDYILICKLYAIKTPPFSYSKALYTPPCDIAT